MKTNVRKKNVWPSDAAVERVVRKTPDWVREALAVEYAEEVVDAALAKLAGKDGATLTEPECRILRAWIKEHSAKRKRARGRPPADALEIAQWCQIFAAFMPLKVAVAIIAEQYGVSRASVYAARRKFLSE